MVPRAGVEPARPYGQRILSPLKVVQPLEFRNDVTYETSVVLSDRISELSPADVLYRLPKCCFSCVRHLDC